MTFEEILRLANEAAESYAASTDYTRKFKPANVPMVFLKHFANSVADLATAVEREACAKVCDDRYMGDNNREDMEARRCAAAIRARK